MMNGGGGRYAIAALSSLVFVSQKELARVGDRGFRNYTQSMVHHHTSYAIPTEMWRFCYLRFVSFCV